MFLRKEVGEQNLTLIFFETSNPLALLVHRHIVTSSLHSHESVAINLHLFDLGVVNDDFLIDIKDFMECLEALVVVVMLVVDQVAAGFLFFSVGLVAFEVCFYHGFIYIFYRVLTPLGLIFDSLWILLTVPPCLNVHASIFHRLISSFY